MMLSPGDRMPFWTAVGLDRSFHSADAQAGRAIAIVLATVEARPASAPLVAALLAGRARLEAAGCDLAVMLPLAAVPVLFREGAAARDLPIRLCPDDLLAGCGVPPGGAVVLLVDATGRVAMAAAIGGADPATLAAEILAAADEIATLALPRPPVLALPRLLDPALCRAVIDAFEAAPNFDSPVSGADCAGRSTARVDHGRKHRRDWLLETEHPLHAPVAAAIGRRAVGELARAFQAEPAHLDRVIVARYDAGAGYFRRHRDDAAPATAFRQWALSVPLNAGEFTGGELRFPGFDPTPIAPRSGEGAAFSASLLHEVTDVTAGRRYALLTFLHDARAEERRQRDVVRAA